MILESIGFLFQHPDLISKVRETLDDLLKAEEKLSTYFKNRAQWKEAKSQILAALASLNQLIPLIEGLPVSGMAAISAIKTASDPVSRKDLRLILDTGTTTFVNIRKIVNLFHQFCKECNELSKYDSIMDVVQKNSPQVFETIKLFARSFNQSNNTVDLNGLPMFLRTFGEKLGWVEASKESEAAEELLREVTPTVEKAKALELTGAIRGNYEATMRYAKSLKRLANLTKIRADESTIRELKQSSPAWYTELAKMVEEAQAALKSRGQKGNASA
jgi:hypothetical protein